MKRFVLVVLALAAFAPVSANAAVPCRDRIYNDWYADGKIATTYSIACYRDALKNIPTDAGVYSSLGDDIRAAMRAAQARLAGKTSVPNQVGRGIEPAALRIATRSGRGPNSHPGGKTPQSRGSLSAGPLLTSTNASSSTNGGSSGVPVPLLVLGGLALVLIAVGSAGAVVKRRRRT